MSKTVLDVKRVYLLMRKRLDERLSPYGLTTSQMELLGHLYQSEPLGQHNLQLASGITAATLTGLLNTLERSGLVSRGPSATDARANVVSLTEAGTALFAKLVDVLHEFENDMMADLTAVDREAFDAQLTHIAANLGDQRTD